jgi:RNA polymerase sigma factor (sigma-70 family)
MKTVLRHIRGAVVRAAGDGRTDGQLLEAFQARRDQAAFETLLARHGPMVLGVCRRVLGNHHDAEDAFQATFLVLARKASAVRRHELVGHWLYGVAYRTAMKARAMSAKRRAKERQVVATAQPESPAGDGSEELLARLDAELSRLPEKYRVPVLLCDLQGKSRRDAAQMLGLAEGTLSSRLAYAKKLLSRRLARDGAVISAGALAVLLSQGAAPGCVPRPLLNSTARAALGTVAGESLAAGAVSAQVVTLTEGVLKAMLLSKLKGFGAVALAACLSTAVVLAYRSTATGQVPAPARGAAAAEPGRVPGTAPAAARAAADELEELRLEIAALRKGLQATRERVTALEGDVRTLRAGGAAPGGTSTGGGFAGGGGFSGGGGFGALGIGGGAGLGGSPGLGGFPPGRTKSAGGHRALEMQEKSRPGSRSEALDQAEAALRKLRQQPDDQQAAEALEKALQRLKDRQPTTEPRQPKGTTAAPPTP